MIIPKCLSEVIKMMCDTPVYSLDASRLHEAAEVIFALTFCIITLRFFLMHFLRHCPAFFMVRCLLSFFLTSR